MNKKAILMASFLLVGSFSFAQKLSPSTSMMLHEAKQHRRKPRLQMLPHRLSAHSSPSSRRMPLPK